MTELDFDELDKAVNSLMGDKNMPAKPQSTPLSVSTTPSEPAPKTAAPVAPASPSSPPVARPTPPAARRGGRFMDVVPATRKEPTSSVSRQGTTVQPAPSFVPPVTSNTPKVTGDTPPSLQKDVTSSASSPITTDWPDPIELAGVKKEETTASDEGIPDTSTEGALAAKKEPEVSLQPEPLSSPFLPDAKVEKRPLGMGLSDSAGEVMVEDENTQLPALPKDVEPALPEELHGDVVSIEADDSTTDPSKHTVIHEEPVTVPKKSTEAPKSKIPEVTVTEATTPSGPGSIPQQYKEEPSSGDQKNGAIYDTDSYHQPLSHPAKKKSGWGWVVWILVILLVGAGGGAALYFMGIF